jgi:hypothetical protein
MFLKALILLPNAAIMAAVFHPQSYQQPIHKTCHAGRAG